MTYSIVARDEATGEMGVATQSQAFAVGHSVPWARAGCGAIATQSMGEPAYGDLGLDALGAGLTAAETLTALRSVDPHPERRQVAMIDVHGAAVAYTGEQCIAQAGHSLGRHCCAVGNMMSSSYVWDAMVDALETSRGPLAPRLMAALHAAQAQGGDFRGKRSAAIVVVRAERSGRPWRDRVVDLRIDAADDPLEELDALVQTSGRYNAVVSAFEQALDGQAESAARALDAMPDLPDLLGQDGDASGAQADLAMWRATVMALAGRESEARETLVRLAEVAPEFVQVFRELATTGLVADQPRWERLLAGLRSSA